MTQQSVLVTKLKILRAYLHKIPDAVGTLDEATKALESSEARIAQLEGALRSISEGNLGDAPWQANYERIKQVARQALTSAGEGMSEWTLISESLPDENEEVLLFWPVPDGQPIIRLGSMFYKPGRGDPPIWKFDLDYGDAGAWVYTKRDDDQPTHWMRFDYPRSLPASAGEGK